MTVRERVVEFKRKWRLSWGWNDKMDVADLLQELVEPAVAEGQEAWQPLLDAAQVAVDSYMDGPRAIRDPQTGGCLPTPAMRDLAEAIRSRGAK